MILRRFCVNFLQWRRKDETKILWSRRWGSYMSVYFVTRAGQKMPERLTVYVVRCQDYRHTGV